jgi:protein-tyrosine phosphatase
VFNLRDFGGHRTDTGITRHGVLMRSDALVGLGPERERELRRLGIRTAVDLREPVERELDPADLRALGIQVRTWPLVDGRIDLRTLKGLEDLYREMLDRCGDRMAESVRLLSGAGDHPSVFFCSAGKDRTGLVSALILSAVGVSDEDVVADYARTEDNMDGEFRRRVEARAIAAGLDEQALASKLGAPRELMLEILAELRARHGGVAGYLAAHGLRDDELDALRGALVAPAQK